MGTLAKRMKPIVLAASVVALLSVWLVSAQEANDSLARGFQDPPASAKPRVWWHWMSGNVTKAGIKADLEWMKRAGIGGFQNFDAGLDTPQIVKRRLVYMTPAWKEAFKYTATLADQLGLEMAIAGSPGWSESGGPWVTPAQAMKKYVWSETRVEGGPPYSGTLPKPPSVTGPYQNIERGRGNLGARPEPQFYADSAVVALRLPENDRPSSELGAKATSSGGALDLAALTDGNLSKAVFVPAEPGSKKAWIQVEFASPATVRGVTIFARKGDRFRDSVATELGASDDGRNFRSVGTLATSAGTIALDAVTGKFFRLSFPLPGPDPGAAKAPDSQPEPPAGVKVYELVLHTATPVNRFQDKAAFKAPSQLYDLATPPVSEADVVKRAGVIDLTSKMSPDGRLDWIPPAGHWLVLRFGYSLTGARNSPASPEATGLEVDKMNRAYVKAYFDNYLDQYKSATGGLMGKRGLQFVITDSWEAGTANWTEAMFSEFQKRRGYDMHPWLPVLAGWIVESAESSDRFLWDFRKTLAELTAENHYDQLTEILHARGMGRYTESHESGRAFIADGMDVKRLADVPMSAMWCDAPGKPDSGGDADIRESASVAHIYGQNLVAAESLTTYRNAWQFSPETLKSTADRLMAMGLNRFVIHTSVHQPVDDKIPGLGLGPYGQWFNRHETWAEMAKPWTTYLARSCFLLQQGRFVADVLYYYGEDSNITALFGDELPEIPEGYNFDFASSDVVLNRLAVSDRRLTTATGMSYRLLALGPNSRHMPLPVLRKIRDLVKAGAAVVGPKPIDSPSLSDDQAEFRSIADELWGPEKGQGRVSGDKTIADALAEMGAPADFEYMRSRWDSELRFVHRALPDGDLYWVSNANARPESLVTSFRVTGKAPELWHADTGLVEPASYLVANGRTIVPLRLDPDEAVFVVFRRASPVTSIALPEPVETDVAVIDGPWDIAFQPGRGAPERTTVDKLVSWSESSDPGVKYFSGIGTYTKTIEASPDWFKTGARLWLDLGVVKNVAEVLVNGRSLGIVWKTPFRVDATSALKPGSNTLEIRVANLWVNRLIGDQQPGAAKTYTYTAVQFYKADSPLVPSGLLGPVKIERVD